MSAPRPVRAATLPPHRVLREILRHYLEFRDMVTTPELSRIGREHIIEHSYLVPDENGGVHKETIAFSFWDLHRGIKDLAPRKREALFYNVILDQKQAEVAKRMGITTVSVGQYVDAAMKQLCKYHFSELIEQSKT